MKEHINKIKEKIDKFGIIKFLVILIVISVVFQAGIFVGYHKAMFYKSTGDNYYRAFNNKGGPAGKGGPEQFDEFMKDANLPGGHGAVGKIVSINLPTIVVASPDNIEKTINISKDTLIRQFREDINSKDLKIGDYIIVLGEISGTDTSPSDKGIINAKLIRLLPPPPQSDNTSIVAPATTSKSVTETK
ncbi:MAG: hypothetical protein WCQ00_02540 [bacterium]